MTPWLRRLAYLLRKRRADADLAEEVELHRALKEEALRRRGLPDRDASAASRRALGNTTIALEDARGVWLGGWLTCLAQDARYGLRMLRRRPAFTAVAVVTLAVGLGATTAVYSIADAVLWRPVPFDDPDRLVQIVRRLDARRTSMLRLADTTHLQAHSRTLDVGAMQFFDANLSGGDLPRRVRGVRVTSGMLPLTGIAPARGALPDTERLRPDDPPVAVLADELWRTWFGAADDVLGRRLRINGIDHVIAAVMPRGFSFPAPYFAPGEVWVLAGQHEADWRAGAGARLAFGRLRPDATHDVAAAELAVLSADLARLEPAANTNVRLETTPYGGSSASSSRPHVLLLLAAAGLVLLVVCLNVLNLLLGRGLDRQPEMAARAALGAGRLRLVRQLATETVLLFGIGGALGLVVARGLVAAVVGLRSYDIPRMEEAAVDAGVVLFGLVITVLTAVVVAVVPAWQVSRIAITPGVRGVRGQSADRRTRLLQRGLVVVEAAVALTLVAGGGLLLQSHRNLAGVDAGFTTDGLWHARIPLPPARYRTTLEQSAFFMALGDRLREEPGIGAAGVVTLPPGVGAGAEPAFLLPSDSRPAATQDMRTAAVRVVDPHYFGALGVSLRLGRGIDPADDAGRPDVAVVNEAFAREYFPDRTPVGRLLQMPEGGAGGAGGAFRPVEIVGVVSDVKEASIHRPVPPAIYLPLAQHGAANMAVLIRTTRDVPQLEGLLRRHTAAIDPEQAVLGFRPMAVLLEGELTLHRLNTALMGGFAMTSLGLAVIGIFGVTSNAVRQRSREIGIRLALGLAPGAALRMVLLDGLRLAAASIAIGLVGAAWVGRLFPHLLYEVAPADPRVLGLAAAVIAVAVTAGCLLPARRAAGVDPVTTLRAE
jgi:putative ABC transport system permease protein